MAEGDRMKISWDGWKKLTPPQIEHASTAILAASITIATFEALSHYPLIAIIWAHIGALAKMVSVFVSEEEDKHVEQS